VHSITLYPLSDTAQLGEGHLLSDYIHPYFSNSFHPVHTDDFLSIGVGPGAFCVIDITPNEFGLVTPETEIMVVARPGEGTCDYESIDNPLECASKLRKNFDYLSSKWCAEAMAEFAKGLQRLVNLLEGPPSYENCTGAASHSRSNSLILDSFVGGFRVGTPSNSKLDYR
jgi:hypothetical protein